MQNTGKWVIIVCLCEVAVNGTRNNKAGKGREGVGCYDGKDGQKCLLMRGQMTRIMLPRGSEPYKYQGKGKSIPDIWNSTRKGPGVGVCLTSEG